MIKSNNIKRIWVDEDFHKMLKRKAIDEDRTVLEISRDIAHSNNSLENIFTNDINKKRQKPFSFRF